VFRVFSALRRRRDSWRPERQFVFIVCYARSGSSVLQSMLASVPGSHVMGENSDALSGLFQSYRATIQAKSEQGCSARTAPGDPWRGAHNINPDEYNHKLAMAFLDEVLRPPEAATIVGFKEVRYFDHEDLEDYLDYIRLTFTPSLLVFNRRDAQAVARSGWWKDHPSDIAAEVGRFDQRTEAYSAVHPDCCLSVNYDHYVQDPLVLRPLFDRLGAAFHLATLQDILAVRLDH
jgi:Sulfotransferase family